MLAAATIVIGYGAVVALFGWQGLLAIVVHVAIMLAAIRR